MDRQDKLRQLVRRAKWEEGISFKDIAESICDMNYNAFMNFMCGYKRLSYKKEKNLISFLDDLLF